MVRADFGCSPTPKPLYSTYSLLPTVLLALLQHGRGKNGAVTRTARPGANYNPPPVSVIVTRPFLGSLKDAGQHGRSHFPPKKLIKRRGKLINNKNSRTSPFRASRRGQILPLLQVSVHTRLPRLVISVRASSYLHRHIFFLINCYFMATSMTVRV